MSHKQLNYAFRLFLNFFGEIHWELPFLVKKVTISERKTHILTKFIFLNIFGNGQILTKIWMCLNNSFDEPIKREQLLTKTAFLPKVSHISQTMLLLFLKYFFGNSQRTSLFSPKCDYLRKSRAESVFFLTCLKRRKYWWKFGFV